MIREALSAGFDVFPEREFSAMLETRQYRIHWLERELESVGDDGAALELVSETLDDAEMALQRRDGDAFLRAINRADRLELYLLDASGRRDLLLDEAHETLTNANETLSGWRLQTVRDLLPPLGSDDVPSVSELTAAKRLLHESYESRAMRARYFHDQLLFFLGATVLSLVLIGTYVFVPVPGSAETLLGGGRPLTGASVDVDAPPFLVPVVLFGVLGASLSGLRSIRKQFQEDRVYVASDLYNSSTLHLSRIVIGMVSALAVFVFLRSGLLQVGPELTPGVVLAAAFASGISESLLVKAVESIAGDSTPEHVSLHVGRGRSE
jgi:hypothetical protein